MPKETAPDAKIAQLTEMQRYVTQQRGTEPPYSGALLHNKQEGFITAWCATRPCFFQRRNTIQAVAGRVFMSPSAMRLFVIWKITRTVCSVLKSVAATVILISAMFSLMGRSRPVSVTVNSASLNFTSPQGDEIKG